MFSGTVFDLAAVQDANAADLNTPAVQRVAHVKHRIVHHWRARVVRDYDGTAVVERRLRHVALDPDGQVTVYATEMVPAPRAAPSRYLNGEPVRPTNALRRWR
jgi:hypothetical protein